MSAVVRHLIESITPASAAMAAARASDGALAAWLAAARHSTTPRVTARAIVCVLHDHGVMSTGVDLGPAHPTAVAAHAMAAGSAAVTRAARAADAELVLVDAGVATTAPLPAAAIAIGAGASGDLATGAALTPLEVEAAVDAGVALVTALAERGLDVLGVGALGAGSDVAAAAVIAALVAGDAALAPVDAAALVAAGLATLPPAPTPQDVLAAVGGRDVAALAGAIVAAAAMYVPIILDGATALAAALVATRWAPATRGYLLCAHGGGGAAATAARAALGLVPLLSAGVGHGDGAAAALVVPIIVSAG